MSVKLFFFDLETTGLNPAKHGIHQLSGSVYVDYQLVKEFNINLKPFEQDVIDPEALTIAGKTPESLQLEDHYDPRKVYKKVIDMLSTHCDKYSRTDKFFLVGYNNAAFDNQFFRSFFEKNNDKYFGSWFWSSSIDCMVLASQHLIMKRHLMPNFKLGTVAAEMGFEVSEDNLHDAMYDNKLTEFIWQKCSGIQLTR